MGGHQYINILLLISSKGARAEFVVEAQTEITLRLMSKRAQPQNGDPLSSHASEPDLKRAKVVNAGQPLVLDTNTPIEASQPEAHTTVTPMLIENENASVTANSLSVNVPESSTTASPAAAELVISPIAKSGPSQGKRKGKKDFTSKPDRRGKRSREGWSTPQQHLGGGEDNSEKKERLAKRKCVLLVGFCGTGYSGMQMLVRFFSLRLYIY